MPSRMPCFIIRHGGMAPHFRQHSARKFELCTFVSKSYEPDILLRTTIESQLVRELGGYVGPGGPWIQHQSSVHLNLTRRVRIDSFDYPTHERTSDPPGIIVAAGRASLRDTIWLFVCRGLNLHSPWIGDSLFSGVGAAPCGARPFPLSCRPGGRWAFSILRSFPLCR